MPDAAAVAPRAAVRLRFEDRSYECLPSETVLQALLRHGVEVSYSCRTGTCLTCLMRARRGAPPASAQKGLKETWQAQGYFLPCLCEPAEDLDLARPDDAAVFGRARVVAVEPLAPGVRRVLLEPAVALYYRAGQFINLRRADGLTRSYSIASVPHLDRYLELHVKRLPGGIMSNWICDGLRTGAPVDIQGPHGSSFYVPGRSEQPMLLIGNGTGLAPLLGILRDGLHDGHRGPIRLYHGSRHAEGLYRADELRALAARSPNFGYVPCLSGPDVAPGCRAGRAEAVAFADLPQLAGWRVFLCGYPPMVHAARKQAYLAGASLDDIHADPFELRDLRRTPRN